MFFTGNKIAFKHGLCRHPLYVVWQRMKDRCSNENAKDFKNYGGRGISVCEEWLDFLNFYEWAVSSGYQRGLFIDRKNNDLGYGPDNCRFVTRLENNQNKRKRVITVDGESGDYSYWAKKLGCEPKRISLRISSGWSEERAVTQPVLPKGKGKTYDFLHS